MDKNWDRNPLKSEVIGRCGGGEKNKWPRRTNKSRTLKISLKKFLVIFQCVFSQFVVQFCHMIMCLIKKSTIK